MGNNEKLIVTATTARSWIYPDADNWAKTTDELIEDVVQSYEAGAAVVHLHLPRGEEEEVVKRIREKCDVIIQAGKSSESIEQRTGDFQAKPDMMAINLNHHDKHLTQQIVNVLHPIEELIEYCSKCKEFGVKPEWGAWHIGSYWNLNYLIQKGLVQAPHIMTMFFNWPGGAWSPPTYDEYMHRKNYLPPNCIITVSITGEEQTKLAAFVLTHGGNVRVGTEDYPFLEKGVLAKNNAEIVERIVDISKYMGREIADPSEARKILGL